LLIYFALLGAFGYLAYKIAEAASRGRQVDTGSPIFAIVYTLILATVVLLAAGTMAKIEGRSIAEYGLPWRRAMNVQFWQAWVISFVSLSLLLASLRLAGAYSVGTLQLRGIEILKNAILWAVALIIAAIFEEFFYRGYLQFTLTGAIGFWPAALTTSALMGAAHAFNPGWTVLGFWLWADCMFPFTANRRSLDAAWFARRMELGRSVFLRRAQQRADGQRAFTARELSRSRVVDRNAVRGRSGLAQRCGISDLVVPLR
jgi:membrane protease YdiL (CAAX protease family)